jgi:PAS domain S-box-containing protein
MQTYQEAKITTKDLSNVLVVDDKEDIIFVIQSALEDQPVNFFSATNGREALRLLHEHSFDLLLLDVKMPDISGFEICRMVKNSDQWRNTKVIIVSASNFADDKLRAFDAGADDYISKPFRIKELQARIKVMLNLRKAERDLTERNEQLVELLRVSEMINLRPDLRTTAEEVVNSAARLAKASCAFLFLWEEDGKHYRCTATYNGGQDVVGKTWSDTVGLAGVVHREGRLIVIPDYSIWENRASDYTVLALHEMAGIPLRLGRRQIGVLTVGMTRPDAHFAPADLEILPTLANQAAIAIENARLYNDLTQSEGRYRLIAENASDLIITFDRKGRLTYVNERVRTLLGYSPEEVMSKEFSAFLTHEGQLVLQNLIEKLSTPNFSPTQIVSQPLEIEALNKDGEVVNLELNCGLLYERNEIIGLQAIGRDVRTRRREAEQERMRALGQLASGVAHDFNNVLANVLGHAQLLESEAEDPEVLQTLRIIEQSALDGAETVRRIQEFTGHHMAQNLDLIDLNVVVQSTIDLSRPRWRDDAQAKGLKIEIERELEYLPPIRGKAAELREVLINLVNNALDAMPPGGGKIGFRTYTEKETVCLDVWDSGSGMPPEVRRRIFEPFYTTKGVRGTGLGLSMAYGIISRYGGQISCESTIGIGTTFHIRLPVARQITEVTNNTKTHRASAPNRPQYRGNILAIDDEPNIRNVLNRALTMVGFTVETAASGLEALALLERAGRERRPPYDLVFSDLGMPEMSGWEVARELYRLWPQIPLVLVTGWGDQLDQEKMVEHHVAHTIAKPFNINELVTLAAQFIPQNK